MHREVQSPLGVTKVQQASRTQLFVESRHAGAESIRRSASRKRLLNQATRDIPESAPPLKFTIH